MRGSSHTADTFLPSHLGPEKKQEKKLWPLKSFTMSTKNIVFPMTPYQRVDAPNVLRTYCPTLQ